MYIILENQTTSDGVVNTLVTTKETRNEADAEFHRILSFAAVSDLPSHAAILMTGDGIPLRNECYKHDAE